MNNLSALRKKLYVAARELVHPSLQSDVELVKIRRDSLVCEVYGNRDYKDLSEKELLTVINKCGEEIGKADPSRAKSSAAASHRQLQLLKFFAMQVAFEYADWDAADFAIDDAYYSGEDLKKKAKSMFAQKKKMPPSIVRWLFNNEINPRCNKYLAQANLKSAPKNPAVFNFEYLNSKQAQFLINKFEKISEELFKRSPCEILSSN